MLPTDHLIPFLLTTYTLILVPGPSVLFIVSRAITLGRRAALVTVLGNTLGLLMQLLLVVAGLGSVLARSESISAAIRVCGAGYLMLLGIRSIRNSKTTNGPTAMPDPPRPLHVIAREGFTVGATNPKGLIILTVILPSFIDRGAPNSSLQLISMGLLVALLALVSDGLWALASGTARAWLGRSPRRYQWMNVGGGTVMIALGVGLALTPAGSTHSVRGAHN